MDHPNTINFRAYMRDAAGQSGHWQPALRPEALDEMSQPAPLNELTHQLPEGFLHDERGVHQDRAESWPSPKRDTEAPLDLRGKSAQYQEPNNMDAATSFPSTTIPFASSAVESVPVDNVRAGTYNDDELVSDKDDERLDPAWGITRQDTAQILGSVNRSATFPEYVPPTSAEASKIEESDTFELNANNQDREEFAHIPDNRSLQQASIVPERPAGSPAENLDWMDEEQAPPDSGLHGDVAGLGMSDLQDTTQARFEEGVPLMQTTGNSIHAATNQSEEPAAETFPSSFIEDEDTSFFSNIHPAGHDPAGAPELVRKSTETVLDSLHMAHSNELDSPKAATETLEGFNQPESWSTLKEETTEAAGLQDLEADDAMWQAVLDDDEFLVEDADDLLPDSDPGSPSSFMASLQGSTTLQTEKFDLSGTNTQPQLQQTPPRDNRPDFARQPSSNPYAPHQPSTADLTQLSPTTHGNVGLTRPGLAPMNSFQSHLQQRPAAAAHAESFSDRAKGGYKSPYDLPMELSKPRKRPQIQQSVQVSKSMPPPPPRSSSMSDKQLQSPFTPTAPDFPTAGPAQSPQQLPVAPPRSISASVQPASGPKLRPSSSFFEELPITTRPRPATGQGRYTPQQPSNIPPPQLLPRSPPQFQASLFQAQASPPRPSDPYAQYQLRLPEKLDPYANINLQPPTAPVPGPAATRYSPAPPGTLSGPKPGPSPRYSPAPPPPSVPAPNTNRYASQTMPPGPTQQPPPSNRYGSQTMSNAPIPATSLPFQPRTSSPLAHTKTMQGPPSMAKTVYPSQYDQTRAISPPSSMLLQSTGRQEAPVRASPPRAAIPNEFMNSPQRSQTQSPSKQRPRPTIPMPSDDALNRPASVQGQLRPAAAQSQIEYAPPARPTLRARGIAEELEFVQPVDDTQFDPLQRWKGAPIFQFGFGGTVVSTFPKHVPRYAMGSVRPQIKSTVGSVSIRAVNDIVILPEHIATFPGPLRTKSKKKDVLSWMTASIARFEAEAPTSAASPTLPDPQKRHDEKIVLWKILRALVEHDGVLDGSPESLRSINTILSPEIHALDEATASQYRGDSTISGSYQPAGSNARPDSVDPMAIETLRKHLLKGNRQDAVWYAVDCRLWSHALLISSTLDKSVWKQVVQEFVKQEVKTTGTNTESLSALYEIFGGNLDESIDQLVPPSARAGLRMVSKADSAGPTKNALEGLDRWRETLSLVINNRSQGDYQALAVLGQLLGDYGRVEASHICYLFSRHPQQLNVLGGADEPQAPIVLLGADSRGLPFDFGRDHDAVLITEVYEFATMILSSGSSSPFMPHLSVYKLQRAMQLTEVGYKTEAQAYCDSIAATLKSSTKVSPYYHSILLGELEELSNRLKQVPVQSSGSWIPKPSLDKVSGSVWNKFSSFVAGDDSDAESKGSGKDAAETGPFARVSGTPSISRSGSQTDLYGMYPSAAPTAGPLTKASSRYAPNGMASSRSSSELTRGRPSLDSQRSPPGTSHAPNGRPSPYEPVNMFQAGQVSQPVNPYQSFGASPPTSNYQATPPQSSYIPNTSSQNSPSRGMPHALHQESYMPTPPPEQPFQQSYNPVSADQSASIAAPSAEPAYGGYTPQVQAEADELQSTQLESSHGSGYEPAGQSYGYEPSHGSGYEPADQSYGYEPPQDTGYVPYVPEPDSPEEVKESKPKKKSFMDDDDDDFQRVAPPSAQHQPSSQQPDDDDAAAARKRANDAAADAAFRAAAEADAARSKEKTLKQKPSSWFGGWLGGKKEDGSLDSSASSGGSGTEPKVYKAKLGEKKMKLYYDEKLKKWVNPDNPDAALKSATPPPPPRMGGTPAPPMGAGPPRTVSGSGPGHSSSASLPGMGSGPPSGPPSRTGTPASSIGNGGVPASALPPNVTSAIRAASTPPPPGAGSRPGTAMSNASGLDDLIGPATGGRKSVKGKKGGKGGRYVDVMAL